MTDHTQSTQAPSAPIAVIGLGAMGAGIAESLARAGRGVLGVDPVSAPEIPGVEQVERAEAFRRAEVLLLSLPGPAEVDDVLAGPHGLLAADSPPRLVIDASTSDPGLTRTLAEQLRSSGHALADAPVSGGASGAQTGSLTVFLGCAEEHLERVEQVLAPVAAHINHVGEVGAGHIAKLVNNLLCGTHLIATREAWRMATAAGIDAERLMTAVNGASGRSAVTEVNLPRWILSGTYDSGFPARLMTRDIALAAQAAHDLGVATPLSDDAARQWQQLLESEGPDADFNRMVDL